MLVPSFRFPHTLFALSHSATLVTHSLNFSVAQLHAHTEKANEKRKGSYDPTRETTSANRSEIRPCQNTDVCARRDREMAKKKCRGLTAAAQTLAAQAAGGPGGSSAASSVFSATYCLIISTSPPDRTNWHFVKYQFTLER